MTDLEEKFKAARLELLEHEARETMLPERRPALERLEVDARLMDDIRDVLAVHGAGSLGRQTKAHLKQFVARNWGGMLICFLLLSAFPLLVLTAPIWSHIKF